MLTWLLLGTALYMLAAFTPSLFLIGAIGLGRYLGSRDDEGTPSPVHGRVKRAQDNLRENYPVFMALGILALIVPEVEMAMATTGAMVFVLARLAYLPLYALAVPVVRSGVFLVGWGGMAMMGLALI